MPLTIRNPFTSSLLNILNTNTAKQTQTLQQLATGKRINSGRDDPAGLIALSNLQYELSAVETAITNNQRSDSMLTVADAAIGEISTLLTDIETLVLASTSDAGLTAAEIAANQAQIDSALASIDRIANTTTFNGKRLLDGTFSIPTTGVAGNDYVNHLRVFSRSQATSDTTVTVTRVTSAQLASATFAFMPGTIARTSGSTQVTIGGSLGTAVITIASGSTQSEVVTTINAVTDQTGVSAIQNSTNIALNSTPYGSDAFISVEVISGGYINANLTAGGDSDTTNDVQNISKQEGIDAGININGQSAGVDGLDVSYSANGLSLEFTLGTDFGIGNTGATTSTSFTVQASGGATFQLGTTATTRATLGIDSLGTYKLGGKNGTSILSELKSGGSADLNSNTAAALQSVQAAIAQVAGTRGRIGGFQKYQVGSSINALQTAQTGLSSAASVIGDTDFAAATAKLNQEQLLITSTISLLGIITQQNGEGILSLLQG